MIRPLFHVIPVLIVIPTLRQARVIRGHLVTTPRPLQPLDTDVTERVLDRLTPDPLTEVSAIRTEPLDSKHCVRSETAPPQTVVVTEIGIGTEIGIETGTGIGKPGIAFELFQLSCSPTQSSRLTGLHKKSVREANNPRSYTRSTRTSTASSASPATRRYQYGNIDSPHLAHDQCYSRYWRLQIFHGVSIFSYDRKDRKRNRYGRSPPLRFLDHSYNQPTSDFIVPSGYGGRHGGGGDKPKSQRDHAKALNDINKKAAREKRYIRRPLSIPSYVQKS